MNNVIIDSPLRYPGGKSKLVNTVKKIIEYNSLYDCTYVEPYTGGGAVGLKLLFEEYAKKIILNDLDYPIYCFWYSLLNETEKFCSKIRDVKLNLETWEFQKSVLKGQNNYSMFDIGFSVFFLNRTNRSGVLNAGVIGGKSQLGKYKIDARFPKNELIRRIERIADYRSRIQIFNLDAMQLIDAIQPKTECFIYFDPPYYVKGKDLYYNHYCHNDHVAIAERIKNIETAHWIVTYDNVKEIRSIYNDFRIDEYSLNYCVSGYSTGKEILIFSNNLDIPEYSVLFSPRYSA